MKLKLPKGVLRRTYLTQIVVVCFAVIVAMSFSYLYSVGQLQDGLEKANTALIGQIQSNVDMQLYNIDRQAINFIDEGNTITFFEDSFHNTANRQMTYQEIQSRLNTLRYINPTVMEIYLYSDTSKKILTGDRIGLFSDFEDTQWLDYLQQGKPEHTWFLTQSGGEAPVPVITLVRPYVSANQIGRVQGCIVVQLSADHVFASLEQNVKVSDGTDIYFFDSAGNQYNKNPEKRLENSVLGQLQDDAVSHSYKHQTIFRGRSQYSGWQYLNVVDRSAGTGFMLVILLIGGGVLLLSLLVMLISNRYTIKPLDNLLKEITAQFGKLQSDNDSTAWDINSLKKLFQGILFDQVHMQDQLEQAAPALKWRILSDIVQGEREDYQELIPYFDMVNIHLYPENYLVAVLEVDKDERVNKAVLEELAGYVEDLINQEDSSGAVFEQGKNSLVAIVSYADDTEDLLLNGLAVFDMVKESIKQAYAFTVSVGIGNPYPAITQVKDSYNEAVQALKYKLITGGDVLLSYQDVQKTDGSDLSAHINRIEKVVALFVQNESEKLEQEMNRFFERIIAEKLQPEMVRQLAVQVINECVKTVNMNSLDAKQLEAEGFYKNYYKIMQMNDAEEIRQSVWNALCTLLEKKEQNTKKLKESNSNVILVEKMIAYIEENYQNKDLSLSHIAEIFHLSNSHVSRIFKEYAPCKLMNYIIKTRIDKAKELLIHTNYKINRIAEETGYSHTSFLRIFKQYTGQTPSEFRASAQSGDETAVIENEED